MSPDYLPGSAANRSPLEDQDPGVSIHWEAGLLPGPRWEGAAEPGCLGPNPIPLTLLTLTPPVVLLV